VDHRRDEGLIPLRPSERIPPEFEATASDGHTSHVYSDRLLPAAETVRRVWPHLGELGITRVARQTGLDRIGIPCWAAFRPNSRNLAGAQGKGLSDAAACISAAMEAVEGAVAEAPIGPRRVAAATELVSWLSPERWLSYGTAFDTTRKITWLEGADLQTGAARWVPVDIIDMDGERSELSSVCKNTNGLASGNTAGEATFHALCELVERDATTLWGFLPEDAAHLTAIDPADFADPLIDGLVSQVAASGMRLRLFDQTSDLGIPVVMAVLGPEHRGGFVGELEVTAGYGAHPVATRAAIRAITEAAQSRVTSIAASRDDIHSAAFDRAASDVNLRLLDAVPARPVPAGLPLGTPLPALTAAMSDAMAAANVSATVVVLSDPAKPYAVVKVLSPDLEDRAANLNWRPGWRAFDAVARL
jgi:ribosomal protein S12 methylthiotransferase accessory factor